MTDALPTDAFSYEYDKNGNMVYDQYKKIRISYNILNLPDTITAEGQGKIVNQYLADGTLLRRSIFDADDNEQERIDYQGEFLFVDDELDKIFTEEGYYQPTEASKTKKSDLGTYFYTLADHLGHTRVVVDEDKNVIQETAYYPYGTPITALSSETKYNYLYTGKEFLDNFDLNWYDHHARYFDPEVGRWWAIDPALQAVSPYMAMGNNPIMFTDADGRTWNPFKAIGQAWDWAWGKGNQFAQWADENGIPSFNVGIGMSSSGQVNPMVNGQAVNSGYSDPGISASASIDQQRSQYSSPTHTGVTGGAVYTSPDISVGPLIFNGAWSYYPGEGTMNYSLAQVVLRAWWERSSGRVEVTDSPIDYLLGAGIGKAIGKGFIRATARRSTAKIAAKTSSRAFFSGAGTEARAIGEGFQTLGQTRAGQNLMKLTKGMDYYPGSQAYNMWARLSSTYAKGIPKGSSVNVFLKNPSPTGIWNAVEKPLLQQIGINIIYR